MLTANTLKIDRDRLHKLQSDNKKEALYHAQRDAISKSLARHGRQMMKRNNKPSFKVRETDLEIHYLSCGGWWCDDRETQILINQAIAGMK